MSKFHKEKIQTELKVKYALRAGKKKATKMRNGTICIVSAF